MYVCTYSCMTKSHRHCTDRKSKAKQSKRIYPCPCLLFSSYMLFSTPDNYEFLSYLSLCNVSSSTLLLCFLESPPSDCRINGSDNERTSEAKSEKDRDKW